MLIDEKKVVIIITYGRSGSTLLQAILNSCEGVHISGENGGIINHLFYTYKILKKIKDKPGRDQKSMYSNQPWFNIDTVNLKRFRRKSVNLFFREVVNPPNDCHTMGFKEIRFFDSPDDFLDLLNFISISIPNCKFIFNSRNLISVSKSGWWKKNPEENVIKRLEKYEMLMQKGMERFPQHSYWIKFDDYVTNPMMLEPLFEFIDVPFDKETVESILSVKLTH